MKLILKEILSLESLKDAKILHTGDENREISGITIMEAPDIAKWVKKGQILLASSFSFGDNIDRQKQLVNNLAKKEIGALILKTRKNSIIDQELVDECKKINLTLIQIPEKISYSSITYPVMKMLFNIQLERADYFIKTHNIFIQLALNNKGTNAILKELEKNMPSQILFYRSNKSVGYSSVDDIQVFDKIDNVIIKEKYIRGNIQYYTGSVLIEDKEIEGIIVPVKVLDKTSAYILLKQDEELKEAHWITLEIAITVLKLELLKKLTVDEMLKKNKDELLDEILSGNIYDTEMVQDKLQIIGWKLTNEYVVTVFRINFNNNHIEDGIIDSLNETIENVISSKTNMSVKDYLVRIKNNKIILLLPLKNNIVDKIVSVVSKIKKQLENEEYTKSISVGIGSTSESIEGISQSYKEAEEALRIGTMIKGEGSIQSFNDLGIYRMLCSYSDKNKLISYIPEPLINLIKYDVETNNNLLYTLEVLLECDSNASKAAQELFIHYKTLLYRVNKIKSIMGLDFSAYENRLSIEIGLKILKIIDINEILNK